MSVTASPSDATPSGGGLPLPPPATPRFSRATRVKRWARRMIFLVHRWLGIVLALLLLMWTLSGFVMMYVAYPATSAEERAAGLAPLDLRGCCAEAELPAGPIQSAAVEMVLGRPVLRWIGEQGPSVVDLRSGAAAMVGPAEAAAIARAHLQRTAGSAPAARLQPIELDQWTLQLRRYAPLYQASFADADGTVLYVSGLTGQVVQDTTRRERFWNWLGAVPHWLYFTPLRQDGALWSQVVIYSSVLGLFLTVTGIYIGIVTLRRGKRKSPFRGLALWHHWTGLIFGLFTLTWIASGLFSMNPWHWFESPGPTEEIPNLAGRPLEAADAQALYRALAATPQPGVVSASVAVQEGRAYAFLTARDGTERRAALPALVPAPATVSELAHKARIAKPTTRIASAGMITRSDAYHYGYKGEDPVLPAYRVIYANADATRLYFDGRTGEVVNFVDAPSRGFRWWHSGLHRLDFPMLRERPVWDVVMIALLAGVTLLIGIGAWMGVRRLRKMARPK